MRATEPIDVLAILLDMRDKAYFVGAPREWRLRLVQNYEEAQTILQEGTVEVIVSDYRIGDRHSWRDLLKELSTPMVPPLVIVADRNADEGMWVEVLAEGAFDLLRKPFERVELDGVLRVAYRTLRQPTPMPARRATVGEGALKKHGAAA